MLSEAEVAYASKFPNILEQKNLKILRATLNIMNFNVNTRSRMKLGCGKLQMEGEQERKNNIQSSNPYFEYHTLST
jgi:hypothetical protein